MRQSSRLPAALLFICVTSGAAIAQSLPPPSRTVYRCEEAGKVVYSDSPCVGAKKVDIQPTRGMNKSTGRELVGRDVRQEHESERLAEAVRPITGMNSDQFETAKRRINLPAEVQRECRELDRIIPQLERQEASLQGEARTKLQVQLFQARAKAKNRRC